MPFLLAVVIAIARELWPSKKRQPAYQVIPNDGAVEPRYANVLPAII